MGWHSASLCGRNFRPGLALLLHFFFSTFAWADEKLNSNVKVATFAGGCFWCMQPPFDPLSGVLKTVVGYAGGKEVSPTYEQVSAGQTNHVEAVQITYDPTRISYQILLNRYWHNIDPTDENGQFCDKGNQYHAVIFYHDEEQEKLAKGSAQKLLDTHQFSAIKTKILPFTTFYPAEDYHQFYYKKHPVGYRFYRFTCGRDKTLKEVWGSNL